jgi:hypothetical protein
MAEFSPYLRDPSGGRANQARQRRSSERIPLFTTKGELTYSGRKSPCQFVDISMGGCCILTESRFTAGALANVEVDLSVRGMQVHLPGRTEWTDKGCRIGVRFALGDFKTKNQLEELIANLLKEGEEEPLPPPADPFSLNPVGQEAQQNPVRVATSPEFVHLIHDSECRAQSWEDGEWPVEVRYVADRLRFSGSIVDLSLKGCSVRTAEPFLGELHRPAEVVFRLRGLPFLLHAIPLAMDDPCTVGIQFSPMSIRKQEDLTMLIDELRASVMHLHGAAKQLRPPDPGSPADAKEENLSAIGWDEDSIPVDENLDDWKPFKKGGWDR